ncbi:MAG: hypothetical protein PHX83_03550 [Acidobacteriia bacterium]|nr:hypothetical protein [Terriglobia bacterium]
MTSVEVSKAESKPWSLPARGLILFEGERTTARLSHYFLPGLIQEGKKILFLDGANAVDPRLMKRLGEQRGIGFEQLNREIEIARAFTCFQLTELIARVPRFLETFPAQVLMITALPELYFDEDVRDEPARAAFDQALEHLDELQQGERPLTAALFSSAESFSPLPARRPFLLRVRALAAERRKCAADLEGHIQWRLQAPGDAPDLPRPLRPVERHVTR